jgi:hypothetical protein
MTNLFSAADIYLFFELLALALCIAYRKTIQNSALRQLPWYILAIVLFDAIGIYRRWQGLSNNWLNDVAIPLEFCFLMLLCRNFIVKKSLRKASLLPVLLYLVVFLADELLYRKTYARLYLRSYLTGVIGLLAVIIMYGYELLGSSRLFRFYQEPAFWICAGVLLFYLGTLPFHLAWNITAVRFMQAYVHTKGIFFFLICVLYSFFSIGILCLKPKAR